MKKKILYATFVTFNLGVSSTTLTVNITNEDLE